METVEVDDDTVGLIGRTIGGPMPVLVAERLAASAWSTVRSNYTWRMPGIPLGIKWPAPTW